jgi:membrane protease YdiL (CAAX protease family)
MDQPPQDPLLVAIVLGVLVASAATWFAMIARRKQHGTLLDYEPRSPVPWGAPVALLAVVFVALTLLAPSDAPAEQAGQVSTFEIVQRLVSFILFQCAVLAGIVVIVTGLYRPSLRDLGLPVFAEELVRDIRIGIVACLAAIAPVYGVQIFMLYAFGPSHHPLVQMVTGGEASIGVVFLASILAIVVAPVSEEVLFRLLLQGWLEKIEGRWIGWGSEQQHDEAQATNDECQIPADSSYDIRHSPIEELTPPLLGAPARGLAGLPHGWLAISISSLLFGAAHSGYGPDPVAIFFLAIILGYVYQRTHRIVPCMVAHALFNSLAMLILWRVVWVNFE